MILIVIVDHNEGSKLHIIIQTFGKLRKTVTSGVTIER
jgi:hypothetical protein